MKTIIAAILMMSSMARADYILIRAPAPLRPGKTAALEKATIDLWGLSDTRDHRDHAYSGWVMWVKSNDPSEKIEIYCVDERQIRFKGLTEEEPVRDLAAMIAGMKGVVNDVKIFVELIANPYAYLVSLGYEPFVEE